MTMRLIILYIALLMTVSSIQAQELNARLTLNTRNIPAANRELFSAMEQSISQLLNEHKWTEQTFGRNERIDCTFLLTINEMTVDNKFTTEMQITSRRPVYNSSYVTTTYNFRDTQFEFSYLQGQSLDVSDVSINDNLVAVFSFYAYIIIGLDFDSFSMNGGTPYFAKAMEVANKAQMLNTKGWEPFSGRSDNRYDLAVEFTNESSRHFHSLWYNYHRTGLDEMAANAARGRIRIIESLADLNKLYDARPSSPLIMIVGDSKLDEIVRISSQATSEERQEIRKLLTQIFPTKGNIINTLR